MNLVELFLTMNNDNTNFFKIKISFNLTGPVDIIVHKLILIILARLVFYSSFLSYIKH